MKNSRTQSTHPSTLLHTPSQNYKNKRNNQEASPKPISTSGTFYNTPFKLPPQLQSNSSIPNSEQKWLIKPNRRHFTGTLFFSPKTTRPASRITKTLQDSNFIGNLRANDQPNASSRLLFRRFSQSTLLPDTFRDATPQGEFTVKIFQKKSLKQACTTEQIEQYPFHILHQKRQLQNCTLHLQFKSSKVIFTFFITFFFFQRASKLNDINYTYCYIPLPKSQTNESLAAKQFQSITTILQEKLKIGNSKLYYFLKDGKNVKSAFDMSDSDRTLIVSPSKAFEGTEQIAGDLLANLIFHLENAIPSNKIKSLQSIESYINLNYKDKIDSIASLLEAKNSNQRFLNSEQLEKVVISKKPRIKYGHYVYSYYNALKNIQTHKLKYKSCQEYVEDQGQLIQNESQQKKEMLIQQYDQELEILKKEIVDQKNQELEDDDSKYYFKNSVIQTRNHNFQAVSTAQNQEEQIKFLDSYLIAHNKTCRERKSQSQKQKKLNSKYFFVSVQQVEVAFKKKKNSIITPILTRKEIMQKLNHANEELYRKNIPKILAKTQFNRKELHSAYIMYKALETVSSQIQKGYTVGEGIDFTTFRNGIYQIFMQPTELAKEMFDIIDFNFSGFLNWQEFLDLMVIIKAKTLQERVNLFIKIADKDGNSSLSQDEVFSLTKICLGRFMKNLDDGFLEDLCEYFTRLIFSSVNVELSKEIPLESIKEVILKGDSESELLSMFCGADL